MVFAIVHCQSGPFARSFVSYTRSVKALVRGGKAHVIVHGLVLCLEREYVLTALAPRFPIVGIDMCKDVKYSILELLSCIGVSIEATCAIPSTIEVIIRFQGIEAVETDHELDAKGLGVDHEVVEAIENRVVVGCWTIYTLKGWKWCNWSSFLGATLACSNH